METFKELPKDEKIKILRILIENLKTLIKDGSRKNFFMCIEIYYVYCALKKCDTYTDFDISELSFLLIPEFKESKPQLTYSVNCWYGQYDYLSKIGHLSLLLTEIENS